MRIIFERLKLTLHPEKTRTSRPDRREGRLRLPRLSPAHADVGEAVGGAADSPLLPPAVALEAKHEAGADEGEGADRLKAQRGEGRASAGARPEPSAPRMGQLLPYRERSPKVQPARQVRRPKAEPVPVEAPPATRQAGPANLLGARGISRPTVCTDCAEQSATRSRACCTENHHP